MAFFNEVGAFCKENDGDEALKPFIAPLQQALGHLQQATMWFMQNALAKPDNAGAGATDYMHLFGLVAHGLYVGADGQGRAGEEGARRRRGRADGREARRPAASSWSACCRRPARGSRASRPAPTRDGAAGGGVLTTSLRGARSGSAQARRVRSAIPGTTPQLADVTTRWEAAMADAYIYDAVRTPRGRGKPDGALHEVTALELAETALRALRERNGLDPSCVDDVVLGCVDPVGEAGGDIARAAALDGRITASRCRACRSTASAPRASTR